MPAVAIFSTRPTNYLIGDMMHRFRMVFGGRPRKPAEEKAIASEQAREKEAQTRQAQAVDTPGASRKDRLGPPRNYEPTSDPLHDPDAVTARRAAELVKPVEPAAAPPASHHRPARPRSGQLMDLERRSRTAPRLWATACEACSPRPDVASSERARPSSIEYRGCSRRTAACGGPEGARADFRQSRNASGTISSRRPRHQSRLQPACHGHKPRPHLLGQPGLKQKPSPVRSAPGPKPTPRTRRGPPIHSAHSGARTASDKAGIPRAHPDHQTGGTCRAAKHDQRRQR